MLVCAFNYLPNGKYSNVFIFAAFSNKSFSGKVSLSVENLHLLTFPDEKDKILSELSFVLLDFVIDCFNFLTDTHCYNAFFLNRNGLSDDMVVLFLKNKYASLVYSS